MRTGLKRVAERRNDALAGVGWERFEQLLADYYRREGYAVDHCGTSESGTRFDGGVDLRLRRGTESIVVQCKHWNAYKVPHNDVHQLLGIMVNEQATGAILVTSGEFTKAAIEAAGRHGHVQLVDGDDLRQMLGPQLEGLDRTAQGWGSDGGGRWASAAGTFGSYAAERLVSAAEDRLRQGGKRRGRSIIAASIWAGLASIVLKLLFALALLYLGSTLLQRAIRSIAPTPSAAIPTQPAQLQSNTRTISGAASPGSTTQYRPEPTAPVMRQQSPADMEAWRKRNAESMEILRESTPELPVDPRR